MSGREPAWRACGSAEARAARTGWNGNELKGVRAQSGAGHEGEPAKWYVKCSCQEISAIKSEFICLSEFDIMTYMLMT